MILIIMTRTAKQTSSPSSPSPSTSPSISPSLPSSLVAVVVVAIALAMQHLLLLLPQPGVVCQVFPPRSRCSSSPHHPPRVGSEPDE